jgi:hypothetical protein
VQPDKAESDQDEPTRDFPSPEERGAFFKKPMVAALAGLLTLALAGSGLLWLLLGGGDDAAGPDGPAGAGSGVSSSDDALTDVFIPGDPEAARPAASNGARGADGRKSPSNQANPTSPTPDPGPPDLPSAATPESAVESSPAAVAQPGGDEDAPPPPPPRPGQATPAASPPESATPAPERPAPTPETVAAAGTGTLRVKASTPSWSQIWVDGTFTGRTTPEMRGIELKSGRHEIKLVGVEVGGSVTRTVEIKAGGVTVVPGYDFTTRTWSN